MLILTSGNKTCPIQVNWLRLNISLPSSPWGSTTFYNFLLDLKIAFMVKWEEDLASSFSLEEWTTRSHLTIKATKCAGHHTTYPKILHNWYLTPICISKIYPDTLPWCWRQCGGIGNLPFTSCSIVDPSNNNSPRFLLCYLIYQDN